jgi:hypothetical protein
VDLAESGLTLISQGLPHSTKYKIRSIIAPDYLSSLALEKESFFYLAFPWFQGLGESRILNILEKSKKEQFSRLISVQVAISLRVKDKTHFSFIKEQVKKRNQKGRIKSITDLTELYAQELDSLNQQTLDEDSNPIDYYKTKGGPFFGDIAKTLNGKEIKTIEGVFNIYFPEDTSFFPEPKREKCLNSSLFKTIKFTLLWSF